jgi:hypothetical protein
MSNKNLMEQIQQYKNEYYTENSKNIVFKTKQKMDCAVKIAAQLSLDDLLTKTMYLLPNTNKVFIDYSIFKVYAHPGIYDNIIKHIQNLFNICITKYGGFEAHIDLKTFTVSAAHRYKDIIDVFYRTALRNGTLYYKKLYAMYVYNTPTTITDIAKLFLNPDIIPRVKTFTKEESPNKIKELFEIF